MLDCAGEGVLSQCVDGVCWSVFEKECVGVCRRRSVLDCVGEGVRWNVQEDK